MMQKAKISLVLTGFIAVVFFGGCESSKYDDLKLRNRSQQERIDELESEHNVSMLELSQCQNQLSEGKALCAADNEALTRKVAVLQGDIDKKSALIEKIMEASE